MNLETALIHLAKDPTAPYDVAELALGLARDEYPDLAVDAYLSELDAMAHGAKRYLRGSFDARVTGLCRYLFHDLGFHGNARHYYDPRNSYFNEVLDRYTGIPLTLSVVAMAVGRRAGLDVVGVGLPGHFVVKAVDGDEEILFDPFHGGRRLTPELCERLVERVTGEPFTASPENLSPLPLARLLQRMLNNLKGIYLKGEDFPRAVRVVERLRQLNPDDALQQRDLGVCLLRAGRHGRALEHLEAYLAVWAGADDAEVIRELLQQGRDEVARWN
jgi:regulator of sirC expression with transglutaminase-like and TPR domain